MTKEERQDEPTQKINAVYRRLQDETRHEGMLISSAFIIDRQDVRRFRELRGKGTKYSREVQLNESNISLVTSFIEGDCQAIVTP